MSWKVPRTWQGETCAILASGPSMSAAVAAAVRGRCRVIAVNNQGVQTTTLSGAIVPAFAPWADVLYAADLLWWNQNRDAALQFSGMKVTIEGPEPRRQHFDHADVLVLKNGGPHDFDDRPTHLRTGRNSGYQAVHLAAHFGAQKILLCGFDMKGTIGSQHWFGEPIWRKGHRIPFNLFCREFARGAPQFETRGIRVINCTPGSAITAFPFQSLEEALHDDNETGQAETGLQHVREGASVHAATDSAIA